MMIVLIEKHKSEWVAEFEKIRANLQKVLGSLAVCIDHIGSTSVPGLGAKCIIHIQVTVKKLSANVMQKLIEASYTHMHDTDWDHVPRGENPGPKLWTKIYFVT
jgi:GrpB-like predicted nucleotidyltransferase (UPF0157 family)